MLAAASPGAPTWAGPAPRHTGVQAKRKAKNKKMNKRNAKGQPLMKFRVESLVEKLAAL